MTDVSFRSTQPRSGPFRVLVSLSFSACVVLSALSLGCMTAPRYGGGRGTGFNGAGQWSQVALASGSSVEMPYPPRTEVGRIRLPDGTRVVRTTSSETWGPMGFIAVVNDFEGGLPGDPIDMADAILEGFLEGSETFEMVNGDAVVRNGHLGTALELRDESNGRRMVVQQFVGLSRAYTFAYLVPLEISDQQQSVEQRFFGSVQLLAGDGLSPSGEGRLDFEAFRWIYPPEAGIAVELPGDASRATSDVTIGTESCEMLEYGARDAAGTTAMIVRVIEIDGDHDDAMLEHLRTLAAQGGGTVRDVRPAQRQGFGGQAYIVDSASSVRYVVDIVTRWGAVQMVHELPPSQVPAQAEARRRFFNSIQFL